MSTENNSLKPWMLVASVAVTAILVGGIIFYGQHKLVREKEEKLFKSERRINSLISEMGRLEIIAQDAINKLNGDLKDDVEEDANSFEEDIDYSNENFGFSLLLPATWEDYQSKERELNFGDDGKANSIDFYFADELPVFNIGFIEKDAWKNIQNLSYYPAQKIGENSKYIFAYSVHKKVNEDLLTRLGDDLKKIIANIKTVDLIDQNISIDDSGSVDDITLEEEDDLDILDPDEDIIPEGEEILE
ncbi:hypothetical protein K8R66_01100 [bacterium]|nr:hypothetical protein [bacterium]